MAKSGLLSELQQTLELARSSTSPVRKENVQFESNGGFQTVALEVREKCGPPLTHLLPVPYVRSLTENSEITQEATL
jgi:hypothetical protein